MARFLLVTIFLASLSPSVFAQDVERPPVHVEVVLDSSGSMLDNDPNRLSALAGMIFTDLAAPDDYLGVQSMKRPEFTVQSLDRVESRRDAIRERVRELRFHGSTACGGPLQKAADELAERKKEQPTARQFIIFLSDGLCPDETPPEKVAVQKAATRLSGQGIRVFSIGLFDDVETQGKNPERDLELMANSTGGEYFRAKLAGDLPKRFADILGRIVGSEAQEIAVTPGKAAIVKFDGYVADAMMIVTSDQRPVRVTRATSPGGKLLGLPIKDVPFADSSSNFFVSASGNTKGRYYTVLRVPKPESGEWKFVIDGPPSASALLIQNYALDPVLEVRPEQDVYRTGEDVVEVTTYLRGRDGKALDDAEFMKRVEVELTHEKPDGTKEISVLEVDGARCTGRIKLNSDGVHRLRSRVSMKSGGLNKTTRTRSLEAMALNLALADGQSAIDLGQLKAGDTSGPFEIDLGASEIGASYELKPSLESLDGLELIAPNSTISPGSAKIIVNFKAPLEHAGGPLDGALKLSYSRQSVAIPVTGTVIPLTFWEKYGKLVTTIGAGILLILLLIILLWGWISRHNFPKSARFAVSRKKDRLDKSFQTINDLRGTGKFFFKNATLEIGGTTAMSIGANSLVATLEARGPLGIELRAADGATLEREVKFSDGDFDVIESGKTMVKTDQVYRVGEFYFAFK